MASSSAESSMSSTLSKTATNAPTSHATFVPPGSKRSLQEEGACSSTSTKTSAISTNIPKLITSFGPAGTKLSVREAGENILNNFCNGFPDTDLSSIIPNLFSGNITELMDPRPNLTSKEEEKRRGRAINQEGEKHEKVVFDLFLKMIRRSDIYPSLLIMRTFEMDTKNAHSLKRKALMTELPGLNLKSAITNAENDFVVLVKDHGVVFIEVKGSTKDNNVRSAEKQLTNVNTIVQSVMKAINHNKHRTIPAIRVIVVPDCTDPSPIEKTSQGSHFIFKDSCENFEDKWKEIVNKLYELKSSNQFSSDEFKELSQVLVGIWSANAVCVLKPGMKTHHLEQNESTFSHVEQLKKIDTVVDTSNVRNENHFKLQAEKIIPLTDIVRTTEQDIFRSCNDIKLCYLTPMQKEIFDFHKQALIHGVAGAGKSLLLLFKVLELVNTSTSKILILAPKPHNLRLYNFLQSNNASVDMIEEFPPSTSSLSNVYVMDIEKFFKVDRSTLMNYDLTDYHIFADDMQNMKMGKIDSGFDRASFFDIGDFVERTCESCAQNDTYCWFMLDVLQGYLRGKGTGEYSDDLFLTPAKKQRTYNIQTIYLTHVMRNTHEVIQVTNQVRETRMTTCIVPNVSSSTPKSGHNVTSRRPDIHLLQPGTKDEYKLPFIMASLHGVLKSVTNPPYSLQLSSVAIIWSNKAHFDKHKESIALFLTTEFGTTPQTIEEQLISKNKRDIIMDVSDNVMSFESPVVVYISYVYGGQTYNICTRARVALTIIDVSGFNIWFKDSNNIDIVWWKPDPNDKNNNTFIRYTCTCGVHRCEC